MKITADVYTIMATIKTKITYENIVEEFKKRNCKLLDTNEEFNEIKNISKKCACG